jgi:hypothetical protein
MWPSGATCELLYQWASTIEIQLSVSSIKPDRKWMRMVKAEDNIKIINDDIIQTFSPTVSFSRKFVHVFFCRSEIQDGCCHNANVLTCITWHMTDIVFICNIFSIYLVLSSDKIFLYFFRPLLTKNCLVSWLKS